MCLYGFFFSSRRRHTRSKRDWSSDVCSSDLTLPGGVNETMSVAGLQVDAASQRVTAKGTPVHLGPTEYRLLHFFVSHPERVYTREQVLDRVWGQNVYVEERTVDVHIRRLRKALAPFGYDAMIQTVRGTGYRFSEKI